MAAKLQTSTCQCPSPCRVVTYDPSLSYALISQRDFTQLIDIGIIVDSDKIRENYEKARDVFEQVDVKAQEKNKQLIHIFLTASEEIQSNFHNNKESFDENSSFLEEKFQVLTSYLRNLSLISEDFMILNKSFEVKVPLLSVAQPILSPFITTFYDVNVGLFAFLDFQSNNESQLILELTKCLKSQNFSTSSPSSSVLVSSSSIIPSFSSFSTNSSYCSDEKEEPTSYFFYKKLLLIKLHQTALSSLEWIQNLEFGYLETVDILFGGTDFNLSSVSNHLSCIQILHSVKLRWQPILNNMVNEQFIKYLESKNWREKLGVALWLEATYFKSLGWEGVDKEKLQGLCSWFLKNHWFDSSYSSFLSDIENSLRLVPSISTLTSSLFLQSQKMISNLNSLFDFIQVPLETFLISPSNITKTQLANLILSNKVSFLFSTISLQQEPYNNDLNQLTIKIGELENHVTHAFNQSFYLVVPALNDSSIERLRLIEKVKIMGNKDPDLQLHLPFLHTNRSSTLVAILNIIINKFKSAIGQIQNQVIMTSKNMDLSFSTLSQDLQAFLSKADFDNDFISENFVKVDMFYRDLSFDSVQQQSSFESLSLFSEIGGFMGLLLGASILTIVEFIDFFVFIFIGLIRKKFA